MPIDKKVTISFESSMELSSQISNTLNNMYFYENANVTPLENGNVKTEIIVDGNWWEQDEHIKSLSKQYPTIQFEMETDIFGEDVVEDIVINGDIQKKTKGWLDLTLSEISHEYGEGEPLDGDDVDRVCEIIKHKLNLFNGNITQAEYDELIELKPTAEPQGEFVNDGNQYQVFDVVCVPFVDGEGFSSTDIFDYEDNHLGQIYGQGVPNDEDDTDTLLSFETIIKEWLISEGYL